MNSTLPRNKFLWIEYLIIAIVLSFLFLNGIEQIGLHPDESQWIASSDAFEAFIHADFDSPIFREHHWALTQPQLTRYIIGIGRALGGYRVEDLHANPYFHTNLRHYVLMIPTPDAGVLLWSRLPMALLAVLAGLGLFTLGNRIGGRVGAYAVLALYLANPFLLTSLRQAMAEAPLLVSVLLAMIAGGYTLTRWARAVSHTEISFGSLREPFLWFVGIGVIGGLAASVKLNGGAVVAASGLLCLLAVVFRPGNASGGLRQVFFIRALIGAVFAALIVFILLNPYLYPAPLARAGRMLKYRVEDMQWQQAYYAEDKMPEPLFDRVNRIGERVFQDYSSLRFPGAWAVNAALTAAGLALLARSARNWGRDPSLRNAAGASVLIVGTVVSLPSLFTPLDWDRYYLLPVIFSMICIAVALGRLVTVLMMRFRPGWRMADAPASR